MKKQTISAREIFLNKRNRVCLVQGASETPLSMVATLNKNLEPIGFTLSRPLAERLLTQSPEATANFYQEILPILKKMVGAHRQFKPMYPNFPAQVMEAHDLELYWNAMMHYWSAFVADVTGVPGVITLPHYEKEERQELQQEVKLKVIDLGTQEDFQNIFTQLVGSNSSLSESDKEIVQWFVEKYEADVERMMPPAVQQKETLALLVGSLMKCGEPTFLLPSIKTATDVLRVAAAMSPEGDVSLAKPTKFRRFCRKERRFFLHALENCGEITEDMLRYKGYWKRLGREIRPGDWHARYPKAFAAFDVLRNDKPFTTYNWMIEACLKQKKVGSEILDLLQQRPGVFARRLDHVMRVAGFGPAVDVTDAFMTVADKVSTPVLLQVFNHFRNRSTNFNGRVFFPKGSVAKVQVDPVPLPPLPPELTDAFARDIRKTLVKRFSALPSLGNVYLDEAMKQQIVPFAMRSASKSLRTIARGSRIALPDNNVARFFLWWKDGDDRTDIDLSAVGYDTNWNRLMDISYYNLRDMGCAHSGDITSAPNGACEFIDLDIQSVLSKGVRFVAMSIYSYTQQNFCDLPECFAGWMGRTAVARMNEPRHERGYAQSGEIFDARTVQDKVDLAAASTVGVPVVFDLEQRQVIWTDLALTSRNAVNNGRSSGDRLAQMCQAITELNKPTLYDLFSMHAEARGEMTSREQANTIFSLHEGITPYDTDTIMSSYMQ
jgi:hypothetical protein